MHNKLYLVYKKSKEFVQICVKVFVLGINGSHELLSPQPFSLSVSIDSLLKYRNMNKYS